MKAWGNGPTPFDLTPYIHCPIAGFFGAEDANPSPADVDRISAQLDKYRKAHEFHRYPDAGHAFLQLHESRHLPGRPRARRVGQAHPVPAAQPADQPPAAPATDLSPVRPPWATASAPGCRPAARGEA